MTWSEHEEKFVREYCRKLMVGLCDQVIRTGQYKDIPQVYVDKMLGLGWLSKKENHLPTAKGWKVASAFLKR